MKRCFALILIILLLTGCGAPAQVEESQPETVPAALQTDQPVQADTVQQEKTTQQTDHLELTLDAEEITLQTHGQTHQLYSGEIDPEAITWTSQDEAVAAIQNGVVTAVSRGETTVTAVYEDQSVTCRVVCDLPILPVLNENAAEGDPIYLPPDVEIVSDEFFADAVFIGDSQGLAFYNCVKYAGLLKGAMHMARNSYSVDSAANNKMLLSWRGIDYVIEDAIAATGAKRVFMMLGINDVGHYDISEVSQIMDNWRIIIERIQTKTPDVQICIQSLPPVLTEGETETVNNAIVSAYNEQLKAVSEETGCVFVDIAPYFMDSTGGMAECYCSDGFIHVNVQGVDTWVKVLKACTDYE